MIFIQSDADHLLTTNPKTVLAELEDQETVEFRLKLKSL